MTYECRHPVFSSPNQGSIDLEYNHPEYGWIPFTATSDDIEEHGRDIYAAAIAGEYGPIAPYDGPSEEEILEQEARAKRDGLLNELDAIVNNPLRWGSYPSSYQQALADYRQALLDVPQQEGFPDDIDWPTFPEEGDPNQSYVPTAVSRRQGRLALLNVGKLDDVEAAIDAIEDPAQQRAAQIEFEADTWERSNPFLQQLWTQLGGTEQELDDLFRLGATL